MRRKDFCVFSWHAERIRSYSPFTQKGYLRILRIRTNISEYSPSTPISFSGFSLYADQKYSRSQITILHGFEGAKKHFTLLFL